MKLIRRLLADNHFPAHSDVACEDFQAPASPEHVYRLLPVSALT